MSGQVNGQCSDARVLHESAPEPDGAFDDDGADHDEDCRDASGSLLGESLPVLEGVGVRTARGLHAQRTSVLKYTPDQLGKRRSS